MESSTPPTNDDIEARIQMATSTADGRPIKDTRTQLFVGNLPYRVRWQDLKDLFRKAGTVLRADVSLGPDNRSRGYGTVLLATAEDAGRAIDMFNGYSWQTRILEVRPDRLPPDLDHPGLVQDVSIGLHSPARTDLDYNLYGVDNTRNLFVGNLPFHCQWQDLKDLFRQAGTVLRADVALGPDGRSRGFGTVVFATDYDADRALKMFNGYEYNGRILKVHYDRYTASSLPATTPASPTLGSYQSSASLRSASPFQTTMSRPNHIVVPVGYTIDFGPLSAPNSPFDQYPPSLQRHHASLSQSSLSSAHSALDVDPLADLLNNVHIPSQQRTSSSSTTSSSESKPSLSTMSSSSLSSTGTTPPSDHSPSSQNTSQSQSSPSGSTSHPNHPGPIAIPPLQPAFSIPMHNMSPGMVLPMISPIYHPVNVSPLHHPAVSGMMTPHGIPITPSMPPFTFTSHLHPMPSPTTSVFPASSSDTQVSAANENGPSPETPIAAMGGGAAALGPGVPVTPFSPGVALSPGAFWGRPGAVGSNPFINPAVGAPVHMGGAPFYFAGGSPMGHPLQQQTIPTEPGGYFDQLFMGPPQNNGNGLGNVAREILKDTKEEDPQPIPNGVTPPEDESELSEMATNISDFPSLTSSPDEQRSPGTDEHGGRSMSTTTSPRSSDSKTPHLPHAVTRAGSEPMQTKPLAEPSKHVKSR